MWTDFIILVLLCLIMAGASFLVGSLPLTLQLSPRSLKLLTALGTGILVGTALVIIIPEGVDTLYSAEGSSHSHDKRTLATRSEAFVWTTIATPYHSHQERAGGALPASGASNAKTDDESAFHTLPIGMGDPTEGDYGQFDTPYTTKLAANAADEGHDEHRKETDDDDDDDHDDDNDGHNPHAYVGISIILGFILMYLIDELPKHLSPPSQPRRFQINLTSLSVFNRTPTSAGEADAATETHDEARASSTTVGLVIHAAADGIALGASSISSSSLKFIIFFALIIHKAPAAFGLTSVLLKQGVSKRAARAHLIIFSLAAPVGAVITWFAAHLLGLSAFASSTSTEFITGILLLFSGGTFLYVAMHTMQDTTHAHEENQTNGFAEGSMGMYEPNSKATDKEGLTSLGVTVLGMLLPLLTQFGHAH